MSRNLFHLCFLLALLIKAGIGESLFSTSPEELVETVSKFQSINQENSINIKNKLEKFKNNAENSINTMNKLEKLKNSENDVKDILKDLKDKAKDGVNITDVVNIFKEKSKKFKIDDIPEAKNWTEKCQKTVGRRMWRTIKATPKRMIDCFKKHMNYENLQGEVEDSMKTGELDVIFKKYCDRRDEAMNCLYREVELVKPCLEDNQGDVNVTLDAIEAGLEFTCHENGDRIALFLAEDGIGCVQNASDAILDCVYDELPQVKRMIENEDMSNIDEMLVSSDTCRNASVVHNCVVKITTRCEDSTPSNILDSLLTQAMRVTPCSEPGRPYAFSASMTFYQSNFFLHILTVILAGLTAFHILL